VNRRLFLAAALVIALLAPPHFSIAEAGQSNMQITVPSSGEAVLNKMNLDQVKQHVLAAGRRCTYVNMYNNNPCWELPEFRVYLNPDPGPDGHLQWNINCDVTRGDFNTLVVQWKSAPFGHGAVDFRNPNVVSIHAPSASTPREFAKTKEMLEAAIRASLHAMSAGKDSPRKAP